MGCGATQNQLYFDFEGGLSHEILSLHIFVAALRQVGALVTERWAFKCGPERQVHHVCRQGRTLYDELVISRKERKRA